jgi:hypothetical protein
MRPSPVVGAVLMGETALVWLSRARARYAVSLISVTASITALLVVGPCSRRGSRRARREPFLN